MAVSKVLIIISLIMMGTFCNEVHHFGNYFFLNNGENYFNISNVMKKLKNDNYSMQIKFDKLIEDSEDSEDAYVEEEGELIFNFNIKDKSSLQNMMKKEPIVIVEKDDNNITFMNSTSPLRYEKTDGDFYFINQDEHDIIVFQCFPNEDNNIRFDENDNIIVISGPDGCIKNNNVILAFKSNLYIIPIIMIVVSLYFGIFGSSYLNSIFILKTSLSGAIMTYLICLAYTTNEMNFKYYSIYLGISLLVFIALLRLAKLFLCIAYGVLAVFISYIITSEFSNYVPLSENNFNIMIFVLFLILLFIFIKFNQKIMIAPTSVVGGFGVTIGAYSIINKNNDLINSFSVGDYFNLHNSKILGISVGLSIFFFIIQITLMKMKGKKKEINVDNDKPLVKE